MPLHPGVIGRDPMLRPGIVRRFVNDRIVQLGRQMCSKTAQDARQFFVRRFLAPLGFQMHFSGCELDPFRTLKVQCGHPVSSAAGVGSRSVRYRLIFVQKTAQDARQFVVRRFWGPFGFQMHLSGSELDPFKTLKVQWGHPVFSTAGG